MRDILMQRVKAFGWEANNSMQRTALRAAACATRRAIVQRFPYGVFFRILSDEIVILFVHGHREPKRWRERQ